MKRLLFFLFCLTAVADDIPTLSAHDLFEADYYDLTPEQAQELVLAWQEVIETCRLPIEDFDLCCCDDDCICYREE